MGKNEEVWGGRGRGGGEIQRDSGASGGGKTTPRNDRAVLKSGGWKWGDGGEKKSEWKRW